MRLFLLQIHKDENIDVHQSVTSGLFDELYHFTDFQDLCAEFNNKLNYYKSEDGLTLNGIEEPTLDESDNGVSGGFVFNDKHGWSIVARVTDVDIEY